MPIVRAMVVAFDLRNVLNVTQGYPMASAAFRHVLPTLFGSQTVPVDDLRNDASVPVLAGRRAVSSGRRRTPFLARHAGQALGAGPNYGLPRLGGRGCASFSKVAAL
jgi:hypothetical protein